MGIVAIAAGTAHTLALTDGGTVLTWGDAPAPPEGLSNVRAIAAGDHVSLALLGNGTVVGWGTTEVPEGLSDVIAIAAGGLACFATRRDGNVVGWGKDPSRKFDPSRPIAWPSSTPPAAVSLYGGFALSLGRDGRATLEKLRSPELGFLPPLPHAWSSPIRAVSAGYSHALAVTEDGSALSWADKGHLRGSNLDTPPDVERATAIAAGGAFSVALLDDGNLVGWGNNEWGQTEVPAQLRNVVALAAGRHFGVALTADGTVAAWGRNNQGQTDVPREFSAVPHERGRSRRPGPLALIEDGKPMFLILDGYPDEASEIKVSALPSSDTLLSEAQQFINLSAYKNREHDGRRAAACLLTNAAARLMTFGLDEEALPHLAKADRLLHEIPRDSENAYEFITSRTVIPVARAAVIFNYCLAHARLGNHNEHRRVHSYIEQLLESATRDPSYYPGGMIEPRIARVREAAGRLFVGPG